ncbi:MAG: V-type ATP synthase subunit I [Candidatus Diapherotrites archaeon]|nr:V-type ATP synthase subunit I [Candidatus Diapherotrites archaeon]
MLWPAKMHHINVLIPQADSRELVASLHERGICQLDLSPDTKQQVEHGDGIRELDLRLGELISNLEPYKPVPQPENLIKAVLFPRQTKKIIIEPRSDVEALSEAEKQLSKLEAPIKETLEHLREKEDTLAELESLASNLSFFPEVPLSHFSNTDNFHVFVGLVSTQSVPFLRRELNAKPLACFVSEKTIEKSFIAVFCRPKDAKELGRILHEVGFEVLEVPTTTETPSKRLAAIKGEIATMKAEIRKMKEQLRKQWIEHSELLLALKEDLDVRRERIDAMEAMGGGKHFVSLAAWVPDSQLDVFKNTLSHKTQAYYMEADEREDAPTLLDNPRLVKPFELLTGLFSFPKYKHLDPTPILALTFPIFFGFMLTDVVYGLIAAVISLLVYSGIGKNNRSMRKFASILAIAGLATILLGLIFGSYLGNLPEVLHERGAMGFVFPMPIDAMKDIMLLVGLTASIGLLHLSLGLLLGVVDNVKNKQYRKAVSDQGVWLLFSCGLMFSFLGVLLPAVVSTLETLSQKLLTLPILGAILGYPLIPVAALLSSMPPEPMLWFGLASITLSVVLVVVFAFLDSGAIMAALSVFDFSGFFGDIFSYTRLMALAVGTAGIALAVNFMAFMVYDMVPYVGLFVALIVLVIGHLFNMFMNGLGAFVHSLRLHFLEFFTKFYEGGGVAYVPFHASRKLTKLKR